jgi:hypothetical protein
MRVGGEGSCFVVWSLELHIFDFDICVYKCSKRKQKVFLVIFKSHYSGSTFPVELSIIRSTISLKTNSDLKVNAKNFWCKLCVFSLSTSAHREVQHLYTLANGRSLDQH